MFIDRTAELAILKAHYRSGRAELFVLYGRRRVGKTELLRHLCTDKATIFFIATLSSDLDWFLYGHPHQGSPDLGLADTVLAYAE